MLSRGITAVHDIYMRVREPRNVKGVYFTFYAVAIYTGLVTLIMPPSSIEGVLGYLLTIGWSILLLLGGVAGALAVFPGWWWLERIGIYGIWAGAGIYGVVVVSLHFTSSGSRLTQLGIIALALIGALGRWVQIRGRDFEPRG